MNKVVVVISLLLIAVKATEIEYVTLRSLSDRNILVHQIDSLEEDDLQVSNLDFSHAKFISEKSIRNVPDGDVILEGFLAPNGDNAQPKFVVIREYRALPNPNPHTWSADKQPDYYIISVRDPKIDCLVAPCNNLLATNITSGEVTEFTTLDTTYAEDSAVDMKWLNSRIFGEYEEFSAIVYGNIEEGKKEIGGVERVFAASQVFVHLPDRWWPCHEIPNDKCDIDMMRTFYRDSNRCLHLGECHSRDVMCTESIPECSIGYTLIAFTGESGCPQYYCDPSFLYEAW